MDANPSVEKEIHDIWLGQDPNLNDDHLHGRAWIEYLVGLRWADQNQEQLPREIDNLLLIVDECIAFFGVVQFAYFQEIRNQQNLSDIHERRAYSLVCGAISHYLYSMRSLSAQGLDVSAKALCRIVSEYVDILSLLIESDLSASFCESQEPDAANKFWHKHLSKGKAAKLTSVIWKRFGLSDAEISTVEEWYKDEILTLSSTVHPTFMASYMASTSGSWGQENILGAYLGGFDVSQFRTIRYVLIKIFSFMMMHRNFPFEIPKGRLLEDGIMHKYARDGVSVIPKICALALIDVRSSRFFRTDERFASTTGVS